MDKQELESLTDKEFEMFMKGIDVGFYRALKTIAISAIVIILIIIIAQ